MGGARVAVDDVTPFRTLLSGWGCEPYGSSFSSLLSAILENTVKLKREDARTLLEEPINTKGLVIHTENEIEGKENEDGNERTDETL